ncbi:hypothetical protein E4T44_09469 [Aureobasidium sp. EXF-8845]|nr:hypothetical protein E4T44_09469 [Aureobasidium sp. EXF-8845]KAI4843097.1 hypothetical protein E4T45_08769 [Aureobasidium sp. EXF-8846]
MSARRYSGPPAATVVVQVDTVRPRANSEPGSNYGTIGSSSEEKRLARALRLQTKHFSNLGLGEKQQLLSLIESPFVPSPIPEEQEPPCEKSQDPIIIDKNELEWLACAQELPPQLGTEATRRFWDFFSLYRLIFALVILANLIAIILTTPFTTITSSDAATGAAINLCIAVLVRNEHVVNIMYRAVCALKPSAPLSVRRIGAKVYSYGGFHSGSATAGMFWYLAFALLLGADLSDPNKRPVFAFAVLTSVLLLAVSLSAFPAFRVSHHNAFEAIHRYAGWACIGLLWAQLSTSVATSDRPLGESTGLLLAESPLFCPSSLKAAAIQDVVRVTTHVH